jgi:hypothetical protein
VPFICGLGAALFVLGGKWKPWNTSDVKIPVLRANALAKWVTESLPPLLG